MNDSVQQIKMWLFEHACKHGMDSILKILVNDASLVQLLNFDALSADGTTSPIDPTLLFLLLLKKLILTLKSWDVHANSSLKWNKTLLSLVIELLISSYEQMQYIPFAIFSRLITRLKLLSLLSLFLENISSPVIVQTLNSLFPHWNENYRTSLQEQFKIKDSQALDKLQITHSSCRKFILQLSAISKCRENYFTNKFARDVKKYISESVSCLNKVITAIRRNIPLSVIEKIISGHFTKDPVYSDDPAVQLILEYIQCKNDETQFLHLIQTLDSGGELHLTDGLGSVSTMSEFDSDTLTSYYSEDEGNIDEDGENDQVVTTDGISNDAGLIQLPVNTGGPSINTMHSVMNGHISYPNEYIDIISDSEADSELQTSNCSYSPTSKLPAIHELLINVNIKPCVIKLHHYKDFIYADQEYQIYR